MPAGDLQNTWMSEHVIMAQGWRVLVHIREAMMKLSLSLATVCDSLPGPGTDRVLLEHNSVHSTPCTPHYNTSNTLSSRISHIIFTLALKHITLIYIKGNKYIQNSIGGQ